VTDLLAMRIHSILALGVTAAACNAAAPTEAPSADRPVVERIVAFGDSYADDGNVFELHGARPPADYPQGRFSTGTNFVDAMGQELGVPIVNFALGGAVTGEGRGLSPPGLTPQVRAFLSGGGGPAFPHVSGRFEAGDLVVITIGGNDARAFERRFGGAPSRAAAARGIAAAPAAADDSVANVAADLDRIAAAGARQVVLIGGDVGRLPEVKGTPVAPIGSAFSARYNQGVQALLPRYRARGVNVRWLDLDRIADAVEADPAAFGLVSAEACPEACTGNPELAARYLFHADGVHLTEAGYRIVGRAAVRVVRAPVVEAR
jgi:phospholipase/lecithinase/hemolysin